MQCVSPQQGFSLLEILITLMISLVGLLAFAQAEIFALRNNQNSYLQDTAIFQAAAITEHMRSCHYNLACITQAKIEWQRENNNLLPQSNSQAINNQSAVKVTIFWSAAVQQKYKKYTHKVTLQTLL